MAYLSAFQFPVRPTHAFIPRPNPKHTPLHPRPRHASPTPQTADSPPLRRHSQPHTAPPGRPHARPAPPAPSACPPTPPQLRAPPPLAPARPTHASPSSPLRPRAGRPRAAPWPARCTRPASRLHRTPGGRISSWSWGAAAWGRALVLARGRCGRALSCTSLLLLFRIGNGGVRLV